MSELEITTRDDKTDFLPGEELTGHVSWQADSELSQVELRLFWHTQGKDNQDIEVVETVSFNAPGRRDRRDFRFQLPYSPYSFSGKLFSLEWALELVFPSTGETERLGIVISPTGTEIVLPPERSGALTGPGRSSA
jgi:hypothetical protein